MTAILIRYADACEIGLCPGRTRTWFERVGAPHGRDFDHFVFHGYTREQLRRPGRNLKHIEQMYRIALRREREACDG